MAPTEVFPEAVQVNNMNTSTAWEEAVKEEKVQHNTEIQPKSKIIEEALQQYGMRFGKQEEEEEENTLGFNRKAFPWAGGEEGQVKELSAKAARSEIEKELVCPLAKGNNSWREEDSDGEEVRFCRVCKLPLGDVFYKEKKWCSGSSDVMHGECMALDLAQKAREEENVRQQKEKAKKMLQHEEYGIDWKVDHIPLNSAAASKLAMRDIPQGMVCLVVDDEARSIRVAATVEPAAAVNLEYLSIALRVRRLEGHEPIFSLDPVDPSDNRSMQEKVFVPDWLASTSVGDVLFQSDYHLKELSMGEHKQPVIGMKSCFEYSEMENCHDWSAREWFMVRKAEIHITDCNVLIPYVRMGVEAREQVIVGGSLEDVPVTRADHPMARYAEAFTRNFDLIAERKSVIYHLRELAKSATLAKFMLDAGIELDDSWFHLAEVREIPCSLEVPQLWNNRDNSEIKVNGEGINTESARHGVFGGVQFGLDKFNLSRGVARTSAASLSAGLSTQIAPLARLSRATVGNAPGAVALQTSGLVTKPTAAGLASSLSAAPVGAAARTGFAASLLLRAPSGGVQVPPSAAGAPPGTALVVAPGAKIPGLGKPLLTGRLAGLPGKFAAAGLVGRMPGVAPSMPQQKMSFGLTRADLQPLTVAPKMPALPAPAGPLSATLSGQPAMTPPMSSAVVAPRISAIAGVPRLQAALQTAAIAPKFDIPGAPQLQGVDLRLDNFDLSSAKRVSLEAKEGYWAGEAQPLDKCVSIGQAFWSSLDEGVGPFDGDDRSLLQKVFNAELSDRRMEGERFAPPDATHSYVQKLRQLIKEEDRVRERRKEHFFSKAFTLMQPGPLFPGSWSSGFEVTLDSTKVRCLAERPQATLHERPEYKGQAADVLLQLAKDSTPVFDNSTEEGLRFRIYQLGSLEIRTVAEGNGEEKVGVVFSFRPLQQKNEQKSGCIREHEKITKATEYVENALPSSKEAKSRSFYQYYLLLETQSGHKIVTERLIDGTVTWEEDPEDLEDRNSLAKVTRTKATETDLTVRDMIAYHATIVKGSTSGSVSRSRCKRYTRNLFNRAVASSGGQVSAMPVRSARAAARGHARKAGRPPCWADIAMGAA